MSENTEHISCGFRSRSSESWHRVVLW